MADLTEDEADRCPYCDAILRYPATCCEKAIKLNRLYEAARDSKEEKDIRRNIKAFEEEVRRQEDTNLTDALENIRETYHGEL